MHRHLTVLLVLIGLTAAACGDDGGSVFEGTTAGTAATTAAGGEEFSTTQGTAPTTTAAVTTTAATTTTATTTTTVAETTTTTTAVVLGPTCTNETQGYTIAYPQGWHVHGEEIDWSQFPSDNFACRLFGPDPFDPNLMGWESPSAQAYVAVQVAPHPGFGAVLFLENGYALGAELAGTLATEPNMSVTTVGDGSVPVWKADGWVGGSRVYGYIIEPWPGCHPLLIGTGATDEAFVTAWAPTVDAMFASLIPVAGTPAEC